MLERNRLQPPRPSAPSQTVGWFDGSSSACSGLFASAEDYDVTGILAGVDPCESRYWWMPELFSSPPDMAHGPAGEFPTTAVDVKGGGLHRTGLIERLTLAGQAARRTPSRSTAAA